ncbi:hypothetical protein A2354_04275 [Candidatus Amesbacteria bacterium RIFOXYB1_FULL_47_12]|nr:MAG: hypothetical protein A2354_04275 [Candidatus Amesbacteria bacterium RIFOXYB1_FULL_47_12]
METWTDLSPDEVKKLILEYGSQNIGHTGNRISPIKLKSIIAQAGLSDDPDIRSKLGTLGIHSKPSRPAS